jgi:hypothetical protein
VGSVEKLVVFLVFNHVDVGNNRFVDDFRQAYIRLVGSLLEISDILRLKIERILLVFTLFLPKLFRGLSFHTTKYTVDFAQRICDRLSPKVSYKLSDKINRTFVERPAVRLLGDTK